MTAITVTVFKNFVSNLGKFTIDSVQGLGKLGLFFIKAFFYIFIPSIQIKKILEQIYFIGMKSVFVICLTGAFTGMVLGLQGYYTLVRFGSEGALGSVVALSLIREMGPVFTAIMVIGRAGSAMAAEIGIMRISEQVDALYTMDINPISFLVSPRLAASIISFPILTSLFDLIGIFGGYITGSLLLGANTGIYFAKVETSVIMTDVTGGFVKSVVFAVVVVTICCYYGFNTHKRKEYGAKGVSISTTSAVVVSCILVFVTDYILTSFLL